MTELRTRAFYPLLVFIAALAVYSHTAGFGLVYFDDNIIINDNFSVISNANNILNLHGLNISTGTFNFPFYRPAVNLSYIIDALLGGQDPKVFHITNILLHGICSVLVLFFLLSLGASKNKAAVLAVIFAVHPALAHAVSWIPGRTDVILSIFFLSSMLCSFRYSRSGSILMLACAAALFFIALMSKETAIAMPVFALMYHLKKGKRPWAMIALLGAPALAWYLLRASALMSMPAIDYGTTLSNIIANTSCLIVYLGYLFWPIGLQTLPVIETASLVPGMAAAMFVIFTGAYNRENRTMFLFGALWFIATLLPALSNSELLGHRLYLPAIGILVVLSRVEWKKTPLFPKLGPAALALMILSLALLNVSNSYKFSQRVDFWESAVKGAPEYPKALSGLAAAYISQNMSGKAAPLMEKALKLSKNDPGIELNTGIVLMGSGDLSGAERHFRKEISVSADPLAYLNLGMLLEKKGLRKEAIEAYLKAVEKNPLIKTARYNIGSILLASGDPKSAFVYFAEEIKVDQNSLKAHYNTGNALGQTGRFKEALGHFTKAIEIDPQFAAAYERAAFCAYNMGDKSSANRYYTDFIKLGGSPDARFEKLLSGY